MKKQNVKRIIAAMLGIVLFMQTINVDVINAKTDTESFNYGFSIDNNDCSKISWYQRYVTKVYLDKHCIGKCTTYIGLARSKQKTSDGCYMDTIMIKCIMKGLKGADKYYGYAEHLTIQNVPDASEFKAYTSASEIPKLPENFEIMTYSPETESGTSSYSVGVSAGTDGVVGISSSTNITKKALEINCYSDTESNLFKECYDYIHSKQKYWKTFNRYAYNESIQRALYTYKVKPYHYTGCLVVKAEFQRWQKAPCSDGKPVNKYSTTISMLTFDV